MMQIVKALLFLSIKNQILLFALYIKEDYFF